MTKRIQSIWIAITARQGLQQRIDRNWRIAGGVVADNDCLGSVLEIERIGVDRIGIYLVFRFNFVQIFGNDLVFVLQFIGRQQDCAIVECIIRIGITQV